MPVPMMVTAAFRLRSVRVSVWSRGNSRNAAATDRMTPVNDEGAPP